MLVSIVIPCYNSEHTIGKVVELAIEEFEKLKDYECEFVLVNDYSRDGTWNAIHALAEKHSNVKGINLAKNFGQHNAIMAAMNYTEGDLIIGMDDENRSDMMRILGSDPEGKVHLLMEYTDRPNHRIEDPWWTDRYGVVFDDIADGCSGLLKNLNFR